MEPCKFEDKIIEMYADVKWLVKDSKRRNGIMETHVVESDKFRHQVTRNTAWRHAFKIVIGALSTLVLYWIFK